MRLCANHLDQLEASVARPHYNREGTPGIVHLGVGAFHRAHQAVYTDAVMAQGSDAGMWMTAGVSLRSPDARQRLAPQDGLFTLRVQDTATDSVRVIGSLGRVLFAGDVSRELMALLTAATTRIVSMTITEKGYCRDTANGGVDFGLEDIQHDLAGKDVPRTAIGWLAAAMQVRRRAGLAGLTLLSCDNLPGNGESLRAVLMSFCDRLEPGLCQWIENNVTFPSTMVDRIVPAMTGQAIDAVSQRIGMRDEAAVVTEPFSQWVIEDVFCRGRPAWERAGATMTRNIAPFETMKLRLLNGAHSALAYLGHLAGYTFVSECVADPAISRYIGAMMREEIAPTLVPPTDYVLDEYIDALLVRFANPRLQHRCLQIAMDGSQKIPQRQLNTIRARVAGGQSFERLALAVAAWMVFATGRDLRGGRHEVDDPLASLFSAKVSHLAGNPTVLVDAMLSVEQVFGDLQGCAPFRESLIGYTTSLYANGAVSAIDAVGHAK